MAAVQDDERETAMRQLFNLKVAPERSRADIDAFLSYRSQTFNFELKSTTGSGFSTVRDLGPDHLAKWRNGLHWLFAVYDKSGEELQYCYYASPTDMEPWYASMEQYIGTDLALAAALPPYASKAQVFDALGEKEAYTPAEAKRIMKNQWSSAEYVLNQDLPGGGYSVARMTELMQARARYLLMRGSTLNNPHIPLRYFRNFEKIVDEHAIQLRALIDAYVNASAIDDATA